MPVRKGTKQVIVGLIFRTAGLTRAEIADQAELSRPTVSAAVQELIADGVLTEEPGEAGPGRTPARLVLAPPPEIVAAIELAPDYEVIALADATGRLVGKPQVTMGRQTPASAVARLGRQLARLRLPAERLRAVVIGCADGQGAPGGAAGRQGELAPGGAIAMAAPAGVLEGELRARFGAALAVVVERAAQLAALGEERDDVVFLKASTSLGLGLVLGGVPRRGRAGDIAHMTVSPRAPEPLVEPARCAGCGQFDCLQNLASTTAIVAQLSALTGEPLDFKTVVERHEPVYAEAIRGAALRLGYALADVVRLVDPESVVIGGQLARAGPQLVLEPIRSVGVEAALVDDVFGSVVKGGLELGRDLQVVERGLDEARG